jgi:hypothetical protein
VTSRIRNLRSRVRDGAFEVGGIKRIHTFGSLWQ